MGQVGIIGLEPEELRSVKSLLRLLRHPDPVTAELARQALAYLELVELKVSETTVGLKSLPVESKA